MTTPEILAIALPFVAYFLWAWHESGWRIVVGNACAGPLRRVVITLGLRPSVTISDRVALLPNPTMQVYQVPSPLRPYRVAMVWLVRHGILVSARLGKPRVVGRMWNGEIVWY